jgi:hypothetical protein
MKTPQLRDALSTRATPQRQPSASDQSDAQLPPPARQAHVDSSPRQLAQRKLIQGLGNAVGPGVMQLEKKVSVIGGAEIDLDAESDDSLLAYYKNYFLPNRNNPNYANFGAGIQEELTRRRIAVPTLDDVTEWMGTRKSIKFGILLGTLYRPIGEHTEAGNTHYLSDQPIRENTRASHTKLTERGVGLMYRALDAIHHWRARYLSTDETFTNVYVSVDGVRWGLHLGDGRQIFPIAGQNMPDYFDS